MTDLSVIIPTCDRAKLLPRTLSALARQDTDRPYEVLLVTDGCTDDSANVAREMVLPYRLQVLEQAAGGAARARNYGARLAQSPLLLFLDDDMEASHTLLSAHMAAQQAKPGSVVLGYFPVANKELSTDLFERSSHRWWDQLFQSLAAIDHRFCFTDICTGNLSMPREMFEAVGGFDENFQGMAGEDYDLGLRLIMGGAPVIFAPQATSWHHDQPSRARSNYRARAAGRGESVIARKHPAIVHKLALGEKPGGLLRRLVFQLAWSNGLQATMLEKALGSIRDLLLTMGWHRTSNRVHGALNNYYYWSGVHEELGSYGEWEKLMKSSLLDQEDFSEIDIDLSMNWRALADRLRTEKPNSVRLWYGNTVLGHIAPVPGAEALLYRHVRAYLQANHATQLMDLITQQLDYE